MANLKEVFENGKSFQLVEGGPKYYVIPPEAADIKASEWHYTKIYNQAFGSGVFIVPEMTDELERRGLIGDAFKKKLADLTIEIQDCIERMESVTDKSEKRELAIKVAQLRNEALAWNQRASAPMNQTCEAVAEDAKMEFLASRMIVNEDGKPVWEDVDAFVKEKNRALSERSKYEVIVYWSNIDPDFISNFPENKVLQELADEELAVDAPAAEPDVEEDQPAPKKSKKKDKKK